jgi:hypothetical protein
MAVMNDFEWAKEYTKLIIRNEEEARRALPQLIAQWNSDSSSNATVIDVQQSLRELGITPDNVAITPYDAISALYNKLGRLVAKLKVPVSPFDKEQKLLFTILEGNLSSLRPTRGNDGIERENIAKGNIATSLPQGADYEQFISTMRQEAAAETLRFDHVAERMKVHFIEQRKLQDEAEGVLRRLRTYIQGSQGDFDRFYDRFYRFSQAIPIKTLGTERMDQEVWQGKLRELQSMNLEGEGGSAASELAILIHRGALMREQADQVSAELDTLSHGSPLAHKRLEQIREGMSTEYNSSLSTAEKLAETSGEPAAVETASNSALKNAIRAEEKVGEKAGGNGKWIVGGIIAATIALGAILWHGRRKESHVEQEDNRRQRQPGTAQLETSLRFR